MIDSWFGGVDYIVGEIDEIYAFSIIYLLSYMINANNFCKFWRQKGTNYYSYNSSTLDAGVNLHCNQQSYQGRYP